MEHCHSFTTLGIQTERTERQGGARPDSCLAVIASVLDSDSDSEVEVHPVGPQRGEPSHALAACAGTPLLYKGDPAILQ